jgi:hypothetical protein
VQSLYGKWTGDAAAIFHAPFPIYAYLYLLNGRNSRTGAVEQTGAPAFGKPDKTERFT